MVIMRDNIQDEACKLGCFPRLASPLSELLFKEGLYNKRGNSVLIVYHILPLQLTKLVILKILNNILALELKWRRIHYSRTHVWFSLMIKLRLDSDNELVGKPVILTTDKENKKSHIQDMVCWAPHMKIFVQSHSCLVCLLHKFPIT